MERPVESWRRLRRAVAVAALAAASAAATRWLRPTWTGSMPIGLYRVAPGSPVRGAIALWCLPDDVAREARARGVLNAGALCPGQTSPIGKLVLAVGGDTLHYDTSGITFRGRHVPMSRPMLTDRAGRPLAHAPYGIWVLKPGQVWLWSPYVLGSWDSRYFGPVGPAGFRELVVPVVTLPAKPLNGP